MNSSEELGVYNIFYESVTGRPTRSQESTTCLDPFHDCIDTKAIAPPICLDFARGCCIRGQTCRRLHRLPIVDDEDLPHSVDIFGRQRSALGPASFLKQQVSIKFEESTNPNELLRICQHLGPVVAYTIDSVVIIQFKHRIYAEFAIEALTRKRFSVLKEIYNVSLEGGGFIIVNWAYSNIISAENESILSLY